VVAWHHAAIHSARYYVVGPSLEVSWNSSTYQPLSSRYPTLH
jgi:hypothetical protein